MYIWEYSETFHRISWKLIAGPFRSYIANFVTSINIECTVYIYILISLFDSCRLSVSLARIYRHTGRRFYGALNGQNVTPRMLKDYSST